MNLLFVCSRNRLRSPTAEVVFGSRSGVQTMSAGTAPDADVAVSADLIEWADLIFVMEPVHRKRLNRDFADSLRNKRMVVLGIPDRYGYMDPALIQVLESRVSPYVD